MPTCYIGIGSNLGDRQGQIDKAIEHLKTDGLIEVLRISSIYETEPVSDIPQGMFLNGVLEVRTALAPRELLMRLQAIERRLGRRRLRVRNSPREMDLDILLYGDESIDDEDLAVPHPRMHDREFVLRGLRELGVPVTYAR